MTGTTTTTLEQAGNSGDGPARDARGRLLPGHGMGRPVGSKNKRGAAEIQRLHDRGEAAWAVVDARLAQGCVKTALFLLSRLLPTERTVELDTSDPSAMADAIVDGSLSSTEAGRITQALKHVAEIQQVDAMRERLDAIEKLLAVQGRG